MVRIDITQRTAAQNVLNNPSLRGKPLHVRAGLPGPGFRLLVGPKVGAGTGDILRRNLDRAIRTNSFRFELFAAPQAVGPSGGRILGPQRLAAASLKGLIARGAITRQRASVIARQQRLAEVEVKRKEPGRLMPSIVRGTFAIKRPIASLKKFGGLFAPRIISSREIDSFSKNIEAEGKIIDQRIKSGTSSQTEVDRFNLIVNQFNRRAGRAEAFELRRFFKERPSPKKPEKITVESAITKTGVFTPDLTLGDVIPKELGGKISFVETVFKGAKEFGDAFENTVPKQAAPSVKRRFRNVGEVIGGIGAATEPLFTGVTFFSQEAIKTAQALTGQPGKRTFRVLLPRGAASLLSQAKASRVPVLSEPLQFINVGDKQVIVSRRALAEVPTAALTVALLFLPSGATRVVRATSKGKVVKTLGKVSIKRKRVNLLQTFKRVKVRDFSKFIGRIKAVGNLQRIKRVPEVKAVIARAVAERKAVEAKIFISTPKIDSLLKAANKELRPLRKKLGPIIREIKLSQKGLRKKKVGVLEQKRLSFSQARVIQAEKLADAKNLVRTSIRDTFLTRSVRKKFGPVTRIIKLGRKKGLSPSQSVLNFARGKTNAFISTRVKQLRAVGIDVNTFRLNLTDSLVAKLLPRKSVRALKKKFPELSKQLAIGKKRGVRKRVIVKRVIKKRTIRILNRTFLNQVLAAKFLRKQLVIEIREVAALFKTLSNVNKNAVRTEFNNFRQTTSLIKKLLRRPDLFLTKREIGIVNKWNISRVNFIEKVQILLGKKIPRKIRKKLGPVIKQIKLSQKSSKKFIQSFNASTSLFRIKLNSLFKKLSSDVKNSVRSQHQRSLFRASKVRADLVKKILGNTLTKRQAMNLLRQLNSDIQRLEQAEIAAFRARTRARNAKRLNDTRGVRVANAQEQNAFFQALKNFDAFEKKARKTQFRKFKEPKAGTGEKLVKTKEGQLQIVKVETKAITRAKVKVKPKVLAITIVRPKQKVKLSEKVKRRAIFAARARQLTIVNVKVRTTPLTKPRAKPREVQRIRTTPRTVTIEIIRFVPKLRPRIATRLALRPRAITRLRTREKPRVKTRFRPLLLIPSPETLSFSNISRLSGPLDVVARVRGKLRKINPVPLSGNQALAFGGFKVDNQAIRSFGVVKGKGKVRSISVPRFRPEKFRKPRGNTKLQRFLIVEKIKFAIDTPGEKREITAKGIAASRAKRLKRGRGKTRKRTKKTRKKRKKTTKKRRKK